MWGLRAPAAAAAPPRRWSEPIGGILWLLMMIWTPKRGHGQCKDEDLNGRSDSINRVVRVGKVSLGKIEDEFTIAVMYMEDQRVRTDQLT